jgi:hypothetical protein
LNLDRSNIMSHHQKKQILNLLILCKLLYNNFKKMIHYYDDKYNHDQEY